MTLQLFLYLKSAQGILVHVEANSEEENLDSGSFLPLLPSTPDFTILLKEEQCPIFFRGEVQVY